MRDHRSAIIDLIRALVEIESPTSSKQGVDRVADAVVEQAGRFAQVTRQRQPDFGDHLRLEFDIPSREDGQVLAIGHLDTVWQLGTLKGMPWRVADGRLWGPGVFDMKAGAAYILFAAKALRDLGLESRRRFVALLNSDEEVGSPTSTPFTKEEALRSAAVLVAEPSAGLEGSVKTARKGGATFRIGVRGIASHAGLDFEAGASSIVELARQVRRVAAWTDLAAGITVNPGRIQGGTATNVVAEKASADIDVRFRNRRQALEIERRFRGLSAADGRCAVSVSGGLGKMPMERTPAVVRLFRLARDISAEMGVTLGEAAVGGGSDGNTTAALGVPTLDGLGAVGEGAHATHESILVDRIADRAALIAAMVHRL